MPDNAEETLVSIYIPTKNRVELLDRAITSCLEQTHKNIEILIVDDASTDSTPDYLQKITRENPKVIAIKNPVSLGACSSRNKAIHIASGEFVTGLDDDDYFLPNRISDFLKAWRTKKSNTLALYSNNITITQQGISIRSRRPREIRQKDLIDSNHVGNQIFTLKKNFLLAQGFDEEFPAWQDLELWYRLLSPKHSIFELVPAANQVIDMSHAHERISTGRLEKVQLAYNKFRQKHNLSAMESRIMALQLLQYQAGPVRKRTLIEKVVRRPTIRNIKQVFKAATLTLQAE